MIFLGVGVLHHICNGCVLDLINQWIALCYTLIGLCFADTVDHFNRHCKVA